ncbi:hypothetical protein AB4400_29835, partial [Vibrio sp. 10N.261.48.A2]
MSEDNSASNQGSKQSYGKLLTSGMTASGRALHDKQPVTKIKDFDWLCFLLQSLMHSASLRLVVPPRCLSQCELK